MENLAMFCYQCEQTAKGEGCMKAGVCGKDASVSALQDLLVYALEGLSVVATDARKAGIVDPEVNVFTVKALFSTLTNVDFDPERFVELIGKAATLRDALADKARKAGAAIDEKTPCVTFAPQTSADALTAQAAVASLKAGAEENADIRSLQHILLFGIKGVAAYADHAQILGQEDDKVYAFVHEALAAIARETLDLNGWVGLVLKCGEINLRAMETA
jgi:hydroxylamine reductase